MGQTGYVCAEGADAILIDGSFDIPAVQSFLTTHALTPRAILITHCHFDHTASLPRLADALKLPIYAHPYSEAMIEQGWNLGHATPWQAHHTVTDGETLTFGNLVVQVLATPGHTDDGLCFRIDDVLFTGDTIMPSYDSYGAVQFPTGSIRKMEESASKLYALPDSLRLLCGHDVFDGLVDLSLCPTLENQKRTNPFFALRR